tara:strand:- start:238 stop:411 length:174 start_codon:yes stop_codon:yes gene_type:complete
MTEEIQSPCMKICIFDTESGYCLGCSRTAEEVEKWGLPNTTNEWKQQNILDLKGREQ